MIDVEETADGLRAIDVAKNEVDIEIDGWVPGGEEFDIDRRVHATISGAAREIRFPLSTVSIEDKRASSWRFAITGERQSVERGEYLIQVENSMSVFIRTSSEFEIRQDYDKSKTTIAFPVRTELTFGFRSREKRPEGQIRIPPTPDGLASALTAMGQYHETEKPDRSYPSMRLHPPLVEVDEAVRPTESNFDSPPRVRIELPPSLENLFVVAPLAYYLSAEVSVVEGRPSSVITGTEELGPSAGASLSEWADSLLKRVFYLDCLVRNAGPYSVDLAEMELLEDISLDIDKVYDLPIDRRLVEYLSVDFERVADRFPEWPLSMFVEPNTANIPTLPHLLNKLALIHPPKSEIMDREDVISRSLDDFQRSRSGTSTGMATDEPVLHKPKRQQTIRHGWVADGAVADGFKCTPESFSNGLTRREDAPEKISVSVILNEEDMDTELADVVQAYHRRREELPLSVEVSAELSKTELRDMFEFPYDYVHYIGHCDDEGLRCADGYLRIQDLEECNVKMFLLNACGSYQQGLSLIQKGSVAGTVTTNDVIDSQAQKVGATLAKLLAFGFTLDRSVQLARRQSIMSHKYLVLGDGTQSLTQGQSTAPLIAKINDVEETSYAIEYEQDGVNFQGGLFRTVYGPDPVLFGNPDETLITKDFLFKLLERNSEPVIYKDRLYWPDELLEELF